jgi:hypothetical protein
MPKEGLYTGVGLNTLFPVMDVGALTLGIGGDIQGNFFYNDVKGIVRANQTATDVGGSFYGIDGENSVYLTFKYDIEKFKSAIIPYVGGYHSWIAVGTATGLSYSTPRTGSVEKEDYQLAYDFLGFGVLVGMDLGITKWATFNVEGRFLGETALTTGATIKF